MSLVWKYRHYVGVVGLIGLGGYFGAKAALALFIDSNEEKRRASLAQDNMKKRFQRKQEDCAELVQEWIIPTKEVLIALYKAEELTEKLKQYRGKGEDEKTKKEKRALWDEMKIISFSRTIASLYSVVLLSILIRIQINVIGKFKYIESVHLLESKHSKEQEEFEGDNENLSQEIERIYLTFTWHLSNIGINMLGEITQTAVQSVIGGIALKTPISREELRSIFNQIRALLNDTLNRPDKLKSLIFPSPEQEGVVLSLGFNSSSDFNPEVHLANPQLRKLLNETRDFLDSAELVDVFESCLDDMWDIFLQESEKIYFAEGKISEITNEKIFLPQITTMINKQINSILSSEPTLYTQALAKNQDLEALAAVIYSSH